MTHVRSLEIGKQKLCKKASRLFITLKEARRSPSLTYQIPSMHTSFDTYLLHFLSETSEISWMGDFSRTLKFAVCAEEVNLEQLKALSLSLRILQ